MQCVQTGSYRTNRIRAGDNIWDGMDIFAGRHSDIQDFLQNPSVVLSNIRAGEGGKNMLASVAPQSFFFFSFCAQHLMKMAKRAQGSVYSRRLAIILIEDVYFSSTRCVVFTYFSNLSQQLVRLFTD